MNSPHDPKSGPLTRALNAWNDFWFQPRDPLMLGLMRILVGLVTLYTFLVHSWTMPEFMGEHAWANLAFRREIAADRPISVGSLTSSPHYAADSVPPAPATPEQFQWADMYVSSFGIHPPGPHPLSQRQFDFAMNFRMKHGYDFRFYGLPFPKNDREEKILTEYVEKYGQTFPPPYPADDDEIRRIDDYLARHGVDPRRVYARGTPIFSVWLDVSDPAWTTIIQTGFVLAAACFVLGLGGRVVCAIVWFANLCYIHRNPHVLFGVDTMMNVLLLYLMVGPSCAALSLDRAVGRWWNSGDLAPRSPRISANVAIRMMQIHLCIIYFVAGLSKLQGASWWSGTAVWSVLGNYEFAPMNLKPYNDMLRMLGANQAVFETVIALACIFTLAFEIGYPFLIWKPTTRWLFLAGAIFLHGFIGLFMGLKTFSLLMLIFNMAFLRTNEVSWIFGRGQAVGQPPDPREERPLRMGRESRVPPETAIK